MSLMIRLTLVTAFLFLVGCGGSDFNMVSVSGTITMDGEPLEGVEVVFAPMEVKGQVEVGPASVGITDSNGGFTLKTPRGAEGAMIGNHRVSVSYGKIDEAEVMAKIDAEVTLQTTEAEYNRIERKARQSMRKEKTIPANYNSKSVLEIKVKGAMDNANFDLKSDVR